MTVAELPLLINAISRRCATLAQDARTARSRFTFGLAAFGIVLAAAITGLILWVTNVH
jgi:hypothetical protein